MEFDLQDIIFHFIEILSYMRSIKSEFPGYSGKAELETTIKTVGFYIELCQLLDKNASEDRTDFIPNIKNAFEKAFQYRIKLRQEIQPFIQMQSRIAQPLIFKRCPDSLEADATDNEILDYFNQLIRQQPINQWLIRESRVLGMISVTHKRAKPICLMLEVEAFPETPDALDLINHYKCDAIYFYNRKMGLRYYSHSETTEIIIENNDAFIYELVSELFKKRLNFFFSEPEVLSAEQLERIKIKTGHEAIIVLHYRFAFVEGHWVQANNSKKFRNYSCFDRNSLGNNCMSLLMTLKKCGFHFDDARAIPLLPQKAEATEKEDYNGYHYMTPEMI